MAAPCAATTLKIARALGDPKCERQSRHLVPTLFLTTEANAIGAPIHPKAMPVILTTTEEFDLWLEGETVEALKLQQPLPDEMLKIVARGEKEDPGLVRADDRAARAQR
jgi:putative SOS response-associated peptidase YedK